MSLHSIRATALRAQSSIGSFGMAPMSAMGGDASKKTATGIFVKAEKQFCESEKSPDSPMTAAVLRALTRGLACTVYRVAHG